MTHNLPTATAQRDGTAFTYAAVVPPFQTGAGRRIAGISETSGMEQLADELHSLGYLHVEITTPAGRTFRFIPAATS